MSKMIKIRIRLKTLGTIKMIKEAAGKMIKNEITMIKNVIAVERQV